MELGKVDHYGAPCDHMGAPIHAEIRAPIGAIVIAWLRFRTELSA